MIEANESVAEFLDENYERSVFRVHGYPDPDKLREFISVCNTYGIETGDIDGLIQNLFRGLQKLSANQDLVTF